jgi:hypothetical protein
MHLSCNCVILSTNKGGKKEWVLLSHGAYKACMVPDSCSSDIKKR